jgi:hypothetical protein
MAETNDIFADGVRTFVGAYGCALHFWLSTPEAHVSTPAEMNLPSARVATIRMTPELMKSLAWMLYRQIKLYEEQYRLEVELPSNMMVSALAWIIHER